MQHSNRCKTYIIRAVKILTFLMIIIIINTLISVYLSPSGHKSNEMWEYYYNTDAADTIFVGTSVTEMINEFVIDEFTGRKSINMGTPSQYFATSRDIIDTAAKQRPIDTVILMMGFDALERDEDLSATMSVEKAYYDNQDFLGKLKGFIITNLKYSFEGRNIRTSNSINKWMSWPVNCIVSLNQIKPSLEKKAYFRDIVIRQNQLQAGTLSKEYFRSSMPGMSKVDEKYKTQIDDIKAIDVDITSLSLLRQMAQYCNDNGIRFIVMISPHKSGYREGFEGDYEKLDSLVKSYVEEMGCMYVNLNDNPFVTQLLTDEYFIDSEHVTHDGIDVASGIMSDILNLLTGKR